MIDKDIYNIHICIEMVDISLAMLVSWTYARPCFLIRVALARPSFLGISRGRSTEIPIVDSHNPTSHCMGVGTWLICWATPALLMNAENVKSRIMKRFRRYDGHHNNYLTQVKSLWMSIYTYQSICLYIQFDPPVPGIIYIVMSYVYTAIFVLVHAHM